MRITINENADFLITDERGDVPEGGEFGLYHGDARFLSRYQLLLDGLPPVLLASRATQHDTATAFLTNPTLPQGSLQRGQLGIRRRQWLDQGLHEQLTIDNFGTISATFDLDLLFDGDFGHVFEIKYAVEVNGAPVPRLGEYIREFALDGAGAATGHTATLRVSRDNLVRELHVAFSLPAGRTAEGARFPVRLAPHTTFDLTVDFTPQANHERESHDQETVTKEARWRHRQREAQTANILLNAPRLASDSLVLQRAYEQSVRDFAALRIDAEGAGPDEFIIAAGIPWFMTLFGRDSLIASYQALAFFPEAAKGALRSLARLQGTKVDVLRVEEPGKILHEYRDTTFMGTKDSATAFPYYGTIDATPLFLMLLGAVWRTTRDRAFIADLAPSMRRALEWMDRDGDRDGDGYLEYLRITDQGLANQGWKDSGDSIRFRDGRMAQPPIALAEVQGYAYAARLSVAEIAEALGESDLASTQRERAATLQAAFNRDFWMEERNYVAEALDGEKRRVDSLTSNPGHLLWTGILHPDQAAHVAAQLLGPALNSGWGVRTMATSEAAYNPISYHNGTVWPHENSLIVAGLARYGFVGPAATITQQMLDALAALPDEQFPELFAGYSREESGFPVAYPTASRPQAWSSGAIFLLLSAMCGLNALAPDLQAPTFLPPSLTRLEIDSLWRDGRQETLRL